MKQFNYDLRDKKEENRDKFIVTIKADSNDADYIQTIEEYSKEKFEKWVLPELLYLKDNCFGYRVLEEDEFSFDYVSIPNSDCGVCHTLEKFTVEYIDAQGKLHDVDIYNNEKMTSEKFKKYVEEMNQ